MITKEQIEQFNKLETEKSELQSELQRIIGFFARLPGNKDNISVINNNHIFVKFAGTACNLPLALFTAELNKRKTSIENRLVSIDQDLESV